MTAGVVRLCRHPIKSHGREDIASVRLSEGAGLPWDRHWAVAHEAARLEPGAWGRSQNFSRCAKAAALMGISAELDEDAARVRLRHPERPVLDFAPDDPVDEALFLDWVRPLCPADRAQPARIVKASGRGMTDTDYPSVSLLSLASNRDLSARMGVNLSPDRWRGNIWIDGTAPFEEFDWVGREIRIGDAILAIKERIVRCKATSANPETGLIDADTLAALKSGYGHQEFGVYARVIRGGEIRPGDRVARV